MVAWLVRITSATEADHVSIGTEANNVVALDANAKLPAVDASQVTGLTASQIPSLLLSKISDAGAAAAKALGFFLQTANNLSDVTPATARSNLGLGTLATQNGTFSGTSSGTNTGDQNLSGYVVVGGNLGTPSAGVATNLTGTAAGLTAGAASAVAVGGITGLGTGVATALAANVGSAGAPVVNGGALGTPSGGVATNLTGTATGLTAGVASAVAVGGITGLGTGVATALAVNVGGAGAPVVNGGALGTPSGGVATNLTGTAASLTAGNATLAATATALATPRAINGTNFDGGAAIIVKAQPQTVTGGGSNNAFTASPSPAWTAYTKGDSITVQINNSQTTTTPTLNISGLGAKTIVKRAATAMASGDIVSGGYYTFVYDSASFQCLNPLVN